MEHTTGEGETTAAGGTLRSGMHLHTGAGPEQETPFSKGGPTGRSSDFSRLRGSVSQLSGRIGALLDERAGAFGVARKHPLIAVGAAFAAGFALAARRSSDLDRHWVVERPRRRLRTLLIGTATAAVVSELHSLAESDERIRTLLGAYLGDDVEGPEDEYADYDELEDDEEDLVPPRRS